MIGILLAAVVGSFKFFLMSAAYEAAFLSAANFLFWWYVVTSSLLILVVGLAMLGVTGAATIGGAGLGGWLGAVLGFAGGATLSTLIAVMSLLRCALLIGGAHFLHKSVVLSGSAYSWDVKTLVIGAVAIVLGIIIGKGR